MSDTPDAAAGAESSATSSVWGLWSTIKQKSSELESTVGSYLAEAPDNVQIKSKLAEWGTTAGKYLDAADERIGELESNAGSYFKNLTGDIKSFIDSQGDVQKPQAQELFNADVATSRLEQELKQLHNNPEAFKGTANDSEPTIDTKELATKYPELKALHDKLVPAKLTSNKFWNEYAELRKPILEQDEKRKKILTQKEDDDEDEGWGSSDEN